MAIAESEPGKCDIFIYIRCLGFTIQGIRHHIRNMQQTSTSEMFVGLDDLKVLSPSNSPLRTGSRHDVSDFQNSILFV